MCTSKPCDDSLSHSQKAKWLQSEAKPPKETAHVTFNPLASTTGQSEPTRARAGSRGRLRSGRYEPRSSGSTAQAIPRAHSARCGRSSQRVCVASVLLALLLPPRRRGPSMTSSPRPTQPAAALPPCPLRPPRLPTDVIFVVGTKFLNYPNGCRQ